MIVKDFLGYKEGQDISKVSLQNLAYPSKNVLIHRGKAYVRPGILNDGTDPTGTNPIIGETVWKDSKSGEHALRVMGTALQLKKEGKWFTIYSGISATASRARFATWVDSSGTVIKKRLAFVDGSANLHQWSGAVGVVASYDGATDIATLDSAATTALLRGFDPGDSTSQAVIIVRFAADGSVATIESKLHNSTGAANTLHITTAPTNDPAAGDLIIAVPVAYTNLSTVLKDEVYTYKNHLIVGGLNAVSLYFSHVSTFAVATGWTFTVPGTKTALTAIQLELDGNLTALISRKDVLWVSTVDKWFKLTKLNAVNAYDQWVEIEDFPQGERNGALPYAVAISKGDIIFMSQSKTLQKIATVEVLGTDQLELLSDEVEDLLLRLDETEMRIYYEGRYIYLIFPNESTMLMLDIVGDPARQVGAFWHTPQILPIASLSIIAGVKYGHSSVRDETFELFVGTSDNLRTVAGADAKTQIEGTLAFGYSSGEHDFKYKAHTKFGISGRMNRTTLCKVNQYFETDGAKATDEFIAVGENMTLYDISDDVAFGVVPWATRSWGGADLDTTTVKRFYAFSNYDAVSYFEHRPVFTIYGDEVEFQLLGWYIDQVASKEVIGEDLYIER